MTIEVKTKLLSSFVAPTENLLHWRVGTGETLESDFASIDFYGDGSGSWKIEWVTSDVKGQGSKIVAEFVGYIGENQNVEAVVSERMTQRKLLDLGFMNRVRVSSDAIIIKEPEIFAQLKAIRMLERGGLVTEKLELTEATEEELISKGIFFIAKYYGHT